MRYQGNGLRILDFDVECRPLAFYGGDFVTKQPTAIAWKWIGRRGRVQVAVIGESFDTRKTKDEERRMLEMFFAAYLEADMLVGHFIRGFDLPLLAAACVRRGLPLPPDRLTHDTKLDFVKKHGMSGSQENLGAMFDLTHPKIPMNTARWEEANMLTPAGIAATRRRVVGDVKQNIELRATMMRRHLLGPPKVWTANGALRETYQP